ncbi:MAG: DNA polymerase III subunit gamma/tau [Armatimonadota bacterium]
MAYLSFSLKYRPRTFDEVVGQQHVSKTLKNALANDRVAQAYLFTGPRGTGKTSTARILAAALNCVEGPTPEPCGKCEMCQAIADDRAMDVKEIDAASNTRIDDIRDLQEAIKYPPQDGRYKVYILDEAHQIGGTGARTAAANAFLKTLEEPPDYVVFLLLTTESHNILDTIRSRCQQFDFRSIPLPDIVGMLRHIADNEDLEVEDAALSAIAHAADGAMRDAESIFDQIVAYADGPITLDAVNDVLGVTDRDTLAQLTDSIVNSNVAATFNCIDRAVSEGKDLVRLVEDWTLYFRDLLRLKLQVEPAEGLRMSTEATETMQSQAEALGGQRLMEAVETLAEVQSKLRRTSQQSLILELAAADLCRPEAAAAPAPSPKPQQAESAQPQPAPQQASEETAEEETSGPAPQPSAAPEAAGGGMGEFSLASIATNWDRVIDEFSALGHIPAGAIVRQGRPVEYEDGTLTIGFAPSDEFHHNSVQDSYTGLLVEAIERLYDESVSVRCQLFSDRADFEQAASDAASATVREQTSGTPATGETQTPDVETPAQEVEEAPEAPAVEPEQPEPSPSPPDIPEPETAPEPAQDTGTDTQDTADEEAEPEQRPMSADEVVSETLNLFEGSVEVDDEEDEQE